MNEVIEMEPFARKLEDFGWRCGGEATTSRSWSATLSAVPSSPAPVILGGPSMKGIGPLGGHGG